MCPCYKPSFYTVIRTNYLRYVFTPFNVIHVLSKDGPRCKCIKINEELSNESRKGIDACVNLEFVLCKLVISIDRYNIIRFKRNEAFTASMELFLAFINFFKVKLVIYKSNNILKKVKMLTTNVSLKNNIF